MCIFSSWYLAPVTPDVTPDRCELASRASLEVRGTLDELSKPDFTTASPLSICERVCAQSDTEHRPPG